MFVNTWSTNDRSVQVEFGTATEDAVAFRLPWHRTCWKMDPAWACAHSIWLCRYRFCPSLNNCQWRGAWAPRRATWKYTQLPTLQVGPSCRDPLKATLASWSSGRLNPDASKERTSARAGSSRGWEYTNAGERGSAASILSFGLVECGSRQSRKALRGLAEDVGPQHTKLPQSCFPLVAEAPVDLVCSLAR